MSDAGKKTIASPSPNAAPGTSPGTVDLAHAAGSFAALGHAARLSIVRCLLRSHPLGRVAGEIQEELTIPASTLTHHLDTLRHESLIHQRREGRFVRYFARTDTLQQLTDFLYSECCSATTSQTPGHPSLAILDD